MSQLDLNRRTAVVTGGAKRLGLAIARRNVIGTNLSGGFDRCRSVVPAMRREGYVWMVSIASVAGKGGEPLSSAYSAATAGVIALTKSLGKKRAIGGMLVNAAAFKADMVRDTKGKHRDYMLLKIPLGRLGRPEECSFSTGAVYDISGGCATK